MPLQRPTEKYDTGYIIPANFCRVNRTDTRVNASEAQSTLTTHSQRGGCRHSTPSACRAATIGHGGAACGRNLLYDLGCTTYGQRFPPGALPKNGRAPSIPFFEAMYASNCLTFDEIWAWEAKKYDLAAWWRPVPADLRSKLHFYNVPVDERPGSQTSALRVLEATARPEDFCVVKVDIDGAMETELTFVRSIADNPNLSRLVDELFFEYHFLADNLTIGWNMQQHNASQPRYTTDTVDDALELLQRLRRNGVRSHFWI